MNGEDAEKMNSLLRALGQRVMERAQRGQDVAASAGKTELAHAGREKGTAA